MCIHIYIGGRMIRDFPALSAVCLLLVVFVYVLYMLVAFLGLCGPPGPLHSTLPPLLECYPCVEKCHGDYSRQSPGWLRPEGVRAVFEGCVSPPCPPLALARPKEHRCSLQCSVVNSSNNGGSKKMPRFVLEIHDTIVSCCMYWNMCLTLALHLLSVRATFA